MSGVTAGDHGAVSSPAAEFDLAETIHAALWRTAWREPGAAALVGAEGDGGEALSHGALAARASRVAHALRERGAGPGTFVALALAAPQDEVVAALGILHAGAALVPLDRTWPTERLRTVLEDCGARLVVTDPGAALPTPATTATLTLADVPDLRDPRPLDPPALQLEADAPAYVIYTSGSTGRPKGVVVSHRALVHLLAARRSLYAAVPPRRSLALVPSTFDPWIATVCWTLGCGGALALTTDAARRDPGAAAAFVHGAGVTHLVVATPLYAAVLDAAAPGQLASLAAVFVGGEALTRPVVERHRGRAPGARLFNEYGPTEATVCTTVHEVPLEGPVPERPPIGRPIGEARCYVVDEDGRQVALGEAGELWIGGPGVAIGYLGQPERTAERFVRDPFADGAQAWVYRTGDRVRRAPDGGLEWVGRLDDQVKVRGQRLELGEVEAALLRHPAVREATVVLRDDTPGGPSLVAYLVSRVGGGLAPAALRRAVATGLPPVAVPTHYVAVEALPRTSAGKLDRSALPAPGPEHLARDDEPGVPRTPLERQLAGIWSRLLAVPGIGPRDDFFLLGGHSLLAGQCVAEVEEALAVELALRDLFDAPTLEAFAARVDAARTRAAAPEPLAPQEAAAPSPTLEVVTPPPPAATAPPPGPGRLGALLSRLRDGLERRAAFHGVFAALGRDRAVVAAPLLTPAQARAAALVMSWAADYIGKTHPELGRKGPICPFVPAAIKAGALHVAVCELGDAARLDRALLEHVHAFQRRFPITPETREGPLASVVIVFPDLAPDAVAAVDGCHTRLKNFLMAHGIMVSQFHPECAKPGKHNQAFALYKAPLPCMVIRHMGVHDIVFVEFHGDAFAEYCRRFSRDFDAGHVTDEHGYVTRYRAARARFGLP